MRLHLTQNVLFLIKLVFEHFVFVDDRFRNLRILVVDRVVKNTGQSVIVLLRNGIVLVIVAAGAGDRQSE